MDFSHYYVTLWFFFVRFFSFFGEVGGQILYFPKTCLFSADLQRTHFFFMMKDKIVRFL